MADIVKEHMFFYAIKHEHRQEVLDIFAQYEKEKYIVGFEVSKTGSHAETNGEHIHFYMQSPLASYTNFNKRILERFKLRGNAPKGKSRQYGKVKKDLENLEKVRCYTLKEGDFVSNMTKGEIDILVSKSFKKNSKMEFCEKLFNNLRQIKVSDYYYNGEYLRMLKDEILRTHILEQIKADVSKAIMERYIRVFIMYHSEMDINEKIAFINQYFLS